MALYLYARHDCVSVSKQAPCSFFFLLWFVHRCVCVATLSIIFDMKSFAFPHGLSIFLSFGFVSSNPFRFFQFVHFVLRRLLYRAVFFLTWMINIFPKFNGELYGVVNHIWGHPQTTLLPLILAICIPLLTELGYRSLSVHLRPSFNDVLQERVKLERNKKKEAVKVYAVKTSAVNKKNAGRVTANPLELNELRAQHRPGSTTRLSFSSCTFTFRLITQPFLTVSPVLS